MKRISKMSYITSIKPSISPYRLTSGWKIIELLTTYTKDQVTSKTTCPGAGKLIRPNFRTLNVAPRGKYPANSHFWKLGISWLAARGKLTLIRWVTVVSFELLREDIFLVFTFVLGCFLDRETPGLGLGLDQAIVGLRLKTD